MMESLHTDAQRQGDARGVRLLLVGASMVAWPAFLVWDAGWHCVPEHCESVPIHGAEMVFLALIAGTVHLGLMISFVLERRGWVARLVGAVVLLPFLALAAVLAGDIVLGSSREYPMLVPLVSLLLLHAMQLWRLGGFEFPRLQPVGGASSRNFDPYAAPGAERIAGR